MASCEVLETSGTRGLGRIRERGASSAHPGRRAIIGAFASSVAVAALWSANKVCDDFTALLSQAKGEARNIGVGSDGATSAQVAFALHEGVPCLRVGGISYDANTVVVGADASGCKVGELATPKFGKTDVLGAMVRGALHDSGVDYGTRVELFSEGNRVITYHP